MIFSLDVRRARKGDCLLLHYGTKTDPGLALIDGGPAQVYGQHLKPRIQQIRAARGLGGGDSLPVDILMVSHIDDDHINGILGLTKDLVEAKNQHQPLPAKVRSFWHNSFDDIIGNDPQHLTAAVTASFGAASLSGDTDVEGLDPAAAMVLASVGQGMHLRDDARRLQFRLNPEFGGKLVMAIKGANALDMGNGLSLTVAGPMKQELAALQKEHDAFLKKSDPDKKSQASLASFTDTSAANLSSIVVLAEVGTKKMLLTGDARGDKILEGLELVGLLQPGGKLHVDILKMPHHGSDRNMETSFLKRITADHYVFSGNGEHGNPERETLQMLLDARGAAAFTIHLTYPVKEIDVERKADWEKEQNKEKAKKQKKPSTKVREDWSAQKHGLDAFFDAHQALADKVSIVKEGDAHVIDLLDAVGF